MALRSTDNAYQISGKQGWTCCQNARDLGGLPTTGGHVGHRRLYRAGNPSGPTRGVIRELADHGISRVLDLRSKHEIEKLPSPLRRHPIYSSEPMIDPRMDHLRDPTAEHTLLDTYIGSVDRNARTIADGIASVIDAPPGGVLVHCMAGKDRTGILIALVLRLVGVPVDAVVADYAVSEDRLDSFFARELAESRDDVTRERLRSRQHSSPQTMRGLLRHIDSTYGDVPGYVGAAGITSSQIGALTRRLISA